MIIQSTLAISTSGISTLRICQRICKVSNSVLIYCIYNLASTSIFVSQYFAYLNMFFQVQNNCLSRQPLYTQCNLWNLRSLFISWLNLTPVNLSWDGVNGSLNIQGLCNRGAWVKVDWATLVYRIFNTTCTLLQIITDLHLFEKSKSWSTWKTW